MNTLYLILGLVSVFGMENNKFPFTKYDYTLELYEEGSDVLEKYSKQEIDLIQNSSLNFKLFYNGILYDNVFEEIDFSKGFKSWVRFVLKENDEETCYCYIVSKIEGISKDIVMEANSKFFIIIKKGKT